MARPEISAANQEQELNPSPYKYRVSTFTKSIFLLLFLCAFIGYFYMVHMRRTSQNTFMVENRMAAISWDKTPMESFSVIDPITLEQQPLNAYLGTWTLLNLWATWCQSCREEMPSLELLQQKMGPTLKIVALSLDDNNNAVVEFIKTHKPSFTILVDHQGKSQKIFGVDKYPETFLISPQGKIVLQFSGPRQWASAEAIDFLGRRIK